ncbi:hypothetical protein HNS38_16620 [Lentimicrobium sp. L6]|uniref:restriction endonuclease subunit S n=1 Tax=Lentimicrobium sp. L6 TaxID=2735916 RepID=UPI0015566B44|nr:restriction endonuclease subunit S [Lentimicrobium sp. L6]NPD86398.1 hypothetical protein [Lentimicrobium sp. L6]
MNMNRVGFEDIIGLKGLFTDGDWVESKDQDVDGNVRLIQLADIGDGSFLNKSHRFLTEDKANELRCTFLKEGDVLIARMPDPLGRACIFPGLEMKAVTVVDICIIRVDSRIVNPEWLVYKINSSEFRHEINSHITGTTRLRISKGNLTNLKFDLPELRDQIKIALVLKKVEAIINQRKESIVSLKELTRSTFSHMFDKFDGKLYSLNEIADKETKGTFSNGPFGSDLLTSEITDSGVPIIYIRDISSEEYKNKANVYVTNEKASSLISCQVLPNDVLISKVGDPPGIAALYPENYEMAIITQDVIRLRVNKNIALPIFIKEWFNSKYGKFKIKGITIHGTRKRFGLTDLKNLQIKLPSIEKQLAFSIVVNKINALKKEYIESLNEFQKLFGSLSQKAFKGDLNLGKLNIDHILPQSKGGNDEIENLQILTEIDNIKKADRMPEKWEAFKEKERQKEIQKKDAKPTKSKLITEGFTVAQFADWIKEEFEDKYFTSEMLLRFCKEEKLSFPYYFTSKELKENRKADLSLDFKEIIFQAIDNKNEYLKLEQVFYNGEEENFVLKVREEDYDLIKDKSPKERSGIYLKLKE